VHLTRGKTLAAARAHLLGPLPGADRGRGVIIDRCNFNVEQRSPWLKLAAEVTSLTGVRTSTICVVLPHATDVQFCIKRATKRGNDGLHDGTENWRSIVHNMAKEFQAPTGREGFDAVYWSEYSGEEAQEIVQLLADVQ